MVCPTVVQVYALLSILALKVKYMHFVFPLIDTTKAKYLVELSKYDQ